MLTVDDLAQEIRRVRGPGMGAGALAESLMPFLTAALAVQTQQGVEELKWIPHRGDQHCIMAWTAETFGGYYGIEHRHEGHYDLWWPGSPGGYRHDTLALAKAAAQSDYETRIRSALVDVPAVESEPVAKTEDVIADLEEVRKAVFGDIGDEPDVYADYDRLSELSGKMRRAIAALAATRSGSATVHSGGE